MLNNIKEKAVMKFGRTGLMLKKYSPEILVGFGVVGFVGTVVVAARATIHANEIVEEHHWKLAAIKEAKEVAEPGRYDDKDFQRDIFVTYVQTSGQFAKQYTPAAIMGLLSISCFLGAHTVMKKRNVAILGAFKAADSALKEYRERVIDKHGVEADREFRHGVTKEKIAVEEIDENGKKKKVKKEVEKVGMISEYGVIFNKQSSSQWSPTPGQNMLWINAQEAYANQVLHSRGHVFLNEVFTWLGLPHTAAGAVTGWVRENGDDFVDFGSYELNSNTDLFDSYKEESNIILDFNVDGMIYDLLK